MWSVRRGCGQVGIIYGEEKEEGVNNVDVVWCEKGYRCYLLLNRFLMTQDVPGKNRWWVVQMSSRLSGIGYP